MSLSITIKLDNRSGFEVQGHTIDKLTPKVARRLIERHAGQCSGTVTARSENPNPGTTDFWVTIYRVTSKSVRKIHDYFG